MWVPHTISGWKNPCFKTILENVGINDKFISKDPASNEAVTLIKKFQNHPSIIKVKENHQGHFSFSDVGKLHEASNLISWCKEMKHKLI